MTVIFSLLYLALSFGDLQSALQPSSEELQDTVDHLVCIDVVSAPCGRADVDFVYRETYCLDFLRFEVVLDGAGIDQKEYKNEK